MQKSRMQAIQLLTMKLLFSLMLAFTAVSLQDHSELSLVFVPCQLLTMKLLFSPMLDFKAVSLQDHAEVSLVFVSC